MAYLYSAEGSEDSQALESVDLLLAELGHFAALLQIAGVCAEGEEAYEVLELRFGCVDLH